MKVINSKSETILTIAALAGKVQLLLCIGLLGGCAVLDLLPTEANKIKKTEPKLEFNIEKTVSNLEQNSYEQLFAERMQSHSLPVPRLEVTAEVRKELNSMLIDNAKLVDQGFARQEQLFPVLEHVLRDEGLPYEVLNLALIESNFRPDANSPAGAAGLWQFMPSTAKRYGLEVSHRKDERKDPILSTVAASRYLKNLYVKFNDWYLALAAYNAGDGAVSKALAGCKSKDFWDLSRSGKLPSETARFVPKFIAASILQKLRIHYGPNVQLAQYLDRHIIAFSKNKNSATFALNIGSVDAQAIKG